MVDGGVVYFRVRLRISRKNRRLMSALRHLMETMEDLEEDFGYREDVKKAGRALRFIRSHAVTARVEKE